MSRYMKEWMKEFFAMYKHGQMHCPQCMVKSNGKVVIQQNQDTDALDGGRAFKLFFVCNNYSHLTPLGWTKRIKEEIFSTENVDTRSYTEMVEETNAEINELVEDITWDSTKKKVF